MDTGSSSHISLLKTLWACSQVSCTVLSKYLGRRTENVLMKASGYAFSGSSMVSGQALLSAEMSNQIPDHSQN